MTEYTTRVDHTAKAFDTDLQEITRKVAEMGGLAERQIADAVQALVDRDTELGERVISTDPAIDALQREVEEKAVLTIARRQPMAVDLRFILAVIKINADLERVGDQAVNIAERVRDMQASHPVDLPVDIPKLASLAATMVRNALQAFIDADAAMAEKVLLMDDEVDEMNRAVYRMLTKCIGEKPECSQQALNVLVISRNLERVGDHATNIAEDVIFWVRGADVRHHVQTNN